jgi:signal transduction histidine kinase
MERNGTPILADWIVLTARWIFIIAVSFWLAFGEEMNWVVLVVVILGAACNIAATTLVLLNRTSPVFRYISTAGDFIFAQFLFYLSIESGSELIWAGLLPLFSAAFYFQWIGAILGVIANAIVQGGLAYLLDLPQDTLLLVGIMLPIYILVGLGLAYLGQRLERDQRFPRRTRDGQLKVIDRKELERRRTIYELISELSATLNYQRVLETSLDLGSHALEELGASIDKLASAVMLFDSQQSDSPELAIATARRFLASDRNLILPGIRGALAQVIETGNAVFKNDPRTDPELGQIIALHNCRSVYLLPLRTGLDAYGVLLFAHPDQDFFTADRREVLEIVRNQSTIAIQNARLYQALESEKERMMEIQEDSRKKLARDLHDGPTQSISAIAMRVNFARRLMDRDPKSASEELYKIEDLARRTTKEIRHMLFTLRPLVLESQGLIAALESMADKMSETYAQDVNIQVDPRVIDLLEPGKQGVVFYIIEEAVNNARKHAQANHIWVRLKLLREGLSLLEVEDDGVGFDTAEVDASYESRGSLGMINLRERTELVNGVLRIDSQRGRGTRIQVIIPLTEEAADRIRRGG